MPGSLQRKDSINRAIRFIKLFYDLKPKDTEITIRQICHKLQCSRTNARHWIDAAGLEEIPIMECGYDKYHDRKGSPGTTFGILR